MVKQSAWIAAVLAACSSQPTQNVVVAPNVDRHPPPQTSDGRVVGADDRSPERALAEGATTNHLAPGWTADKTGLKFDPKREPAGPEPGATRISTPDAGTEVVPSGD
ncbi:MAG TPA: hypothetical protein VGQ57_07815 [Polyangiaceae bacterium]|nr:hypothetical protein [Polyangiaceae bacterium]